VETVGKKLKRKDCEKKEEAGDFSSIKKNAIRRFWYYLADNICLWGGDSKNRLQNKINTSHRSL
jgi:hypothetical protein